MTNIFTTSFEVGSPTITSSFGGVRYISNEESQLPNAFGYLSNNMHADFTALVATSMKRFSPVYAASFLSSLY